VAVSQPRSSVYQPLLCKLSETATALRVQQEEVAKTTGNLPDLQEQPKLMGFETPVAYKQWHAGVSVLFADISGYTAMSTQVEPEQVGA
jgi:class 3 adenylate cyclase